MIVRAQASSADRLRNLFIGGLVLQLVGVVIAVLAWPDEQVADDPLGADLTVMTEETGNWFVTFIGLGLVQAGALLLLVAVIGYGVKLGREAARV